MGGTYETIDHKIGFVYTKLKPYGPILKVAGYELARIDGLTEILQSDERLPKQDPEKKKKIFKEEFSEKICAPRAGYRHFMSSYTSFWLPGIVGNTHVFSWKVYETLANYFEFRADMITQRTLSKRLEAYKIKKS